MGVSDMSEYIPHTTINKIESSNPTHQLEHPVVKWILIGITLLFTFVFLILPVLVVFQQAFSKGILSYFKNLIEPDTVSSIELTLLAASCSVVINTIFGLAAAYALTRFTFRGKNLLISLIDIPFMVSPVVSGLLFVLLFGAQGWFGGILLGMNMKIIFATPGIILATCFVTFPFVARELMPVMQTLGSESEEAAIVLGAKPFKMFFKVTLPSIKWGLLYGVMLCSARAIGEFGAVSVVSGHIRGSTNTIPLQVEILYNEYNFSGAFSVASLLMLIAFVSLIMRTVIDKKRS
jgi:sulfate transport system permease protein